jgi:NAD(P)-dependent dehydrogenase (short-subunit alcohol dehydrogenase family)
MKNFRGKVAVITGGASGIGLATAQALAKLGARLVLADIEDNVLRSAVNDLSSAGARAIGVRTDVGDKGSVDALADRSWSEFGRVDILFNNAGVAVFGPTQTMTHADWDWSIRVNLWGPIHGIEAFAPRMIADKHGGHVLFTASFAGLVPNRELGPYCVTKFGVVALAESLHKDLRSEGIGVSVLCPMRVTSRIDFSFRNRPDELGGPAANRTYTDEERAALQGRELSAAQVADLVVDAMREDRLYVHTHREARQYVKRRWERMDAAFDFAL